MRTIVALSPYEIESDNLAIDDNASMCTAFIPTHLPTARHPTLEA